MKTRNFSIIAHIDHGKSTLADRLLELGDYASEPHQQSKASNRQNGNSHINTQERILDTLELEQEKGITIKLQAVRFHWKDYQLNLIDTPGHVDFSYEVSRSLAACESTVLLVDAKQGIQAQTISNIRKATEQNLVIIPVVNKIDLPNVDIEQRILELAILLDIEPEEVLTVSARTGEGVEKLMEEIVKRTPPPIKTTEYTINKNKINSKSKFISIKKKPLKALIFDSFYQKHKGVVLTVRVFDGKVKASGVGTSNNAELYLLRKKTVFHPIEIGVFTPKLKTVKQLEAGDVGYIATGLKDIKQFTVGDTVSDSPNTKPLPGYKAPKPNVYATFFPTDPDKIKELKTALSKLCLNDAALTYSMQKSSYLGAGFRVGFLGLLHMEIIQERLEREFDVELIITAPTVEYKIKKTSGQTVSIQHAQEFPDPAEIDTILEPWVDLRVMTPPEYIGDVMELCQFKRGIGVQKDTEDNKVKKDNIKTNKDENNISSSLNIEKYITLHYHIPLTSLISNFFNLLKNVTHGYASMEYETLDYRQVALVKVRILVNGDEIPALSFLSYKEYARNRGTKLLDIMKEVIPRAQFKIPLQAAIGGKIIARKNIKALRKDVTAKLYGGDYSRKKKLLEKQKKGKKRLRQIGSISIPQEAFLAILKT